MGGAAECTARWDGGEWYCSIHIDKRIKVENSELILSCLHVMYMVSFFAYLSLIRKKHDIFQTNNTQAAENLCRNNVGCNIYKFASKGENWVYKKVCKKK